MKKPVRKIEKVVLYEDMNVTGKLTDLIQKFQQIVDNFPNAELNNEYHYDYDDSYYVNKIFYFDTESDEEFNARMEEWQKWKDNRKDIDEAANQKRAAAREAKKQNRYKNLKKH